MTSTATADLNVWIYYKDDNDKVQRVQGGLLWDRSTEGNWRAYDVQKQLNSLIADGIVDKAGDWIPGSRIVRIGRERAIDI